MSDTPTTTTPAAPVQLKLNATEIAEQLKANLAQADQSLTQLASNIEAGERQIAEWRRVQLLIIGRKQTVVDLLTKIVEQPADGAATPPAAQ